MRRLVVASSGLAVVCGLLASGQPLGAVHPVSVSVDMVRIAAGSFVMGDPFGEGLTDERPQHAVHVGAYFMDRHEVTKALWDEVRAWGLTNGFVDLPPGTAKRAEHPVAHLSWLAAVTWCNARSLREGLEPCYQTGGVVLQSGVGDPVCEWSVSGFRLPTEAEWERAARAGFDGRRYPWGDTICHDHANYVASRTAFAYDVSPGEVAHWHPVYGKGNTPFTSPVGSFPANGYGLFDMIGNVPEYCWDWYDARYYHSAPARDPKGPLSGYTRVFRGGGFSCGAGGSRLAARSRVEPNCGGFGMGFRTVRTALDERSSSIP